MNDKLFVLWLMFFTIGPSYACVANSRRTIADSKPAEETTAPILDSELVTKLLANPEMAALLTALAKNMK